MPNKEEFAFFIEEMLNNAVREFKETKQYELLQEKLSRMDRDCDTILTADEKVFVLECFETIFEMSGQQELYVYRKGMLDGIEILKWLGLA